MDAYKKNAKTFLLITTMNYSSSSSVFGSKPQHVNEKTDIIVKNDSVCNYKERIININLPEGR